MEDTKIRLLLKTIAQESATLRLLSYDSERLKKQFGLSEAELEALRSVDLLRASALSGRRNPADPKALFPNAQVTGAGSAATAIHAASPPPPPPPPGALVVNMIPRSLSGEQNQDSEPTIAVNPANTQQIAATAFTPNPLGSGNAPIYISSDGGQTWVLNAIVPSPVNTADITIGFSGTTNNLYAGTIVLPIQDDTPRVNICRTNNFQTAGAMSVLFNQQGKGLDQPRVQATTVGGNDRVYVGVNDFNASPQTATIEVSLNAAAAAPTFKAVRIDPRPTGTAGQDGPAIQPAIAADGKTIYAIYYHWSAITTPGNQITADVVVVRDDTGGGGTNPFTALLDSDGHAGKRVVQGVTFQFDAFLGQERVGGDVAIAVDPRNSSTLYIVYSDQQATGYTLHVRRSTDRGVTWSSDLLTIPNALNPFLAINALGTLAFLYQQLTGTGASQRWVTHLQRTLNGVNWNDLILATVPANTPAKQFDPYLGDYVHLQAVGNVFYGIFCANNTPDHANFPNGVQYQRNANFTTHTLLALDGVTPVPISIDPFFFKVTN